MAQVKISALTAADPLTGIEEAPFVQGGATKKATTEQIREYVASQPNVFSVTQRIEDAAPELQFSENDTVDKNWGFKGVAGALRLDELNDAFSTTGTHHTFTHGGGTQFGSPTGGDQGAGTVNATGLYENGTGVAKLSGGADANFTAMPQVGGDPIVESGSNADGEFTRWADGTQICVRVLSNTQVAGITTGIDANNFDFPVLFSSRPNMPRETADSSLVQNPATYNTIDDYVFSCRDTSRWNGRARTTHDSGDVNPVALFAFGRWK